MKTIKKEKTTTTTYEVYVASDGTEFINAGDCRTYEQGIECILYAKYNPLVVGNIGEFDLLQAGSDENCVDVVSCKTQADADVVKQVFLLENSYLKEDGYKERCVKYLAEIDRATEEDNLLFIGRGYEKDNFYLIGTRNELIERLQNFVPKKEESNN